MRDSVPVLSVRDLSVTFDTDTRPITAVDRVSFDLHAGEVLGVVGESGCGKSVTASSILRLLPSPPGRIAGGSVHFEGRDLLRAPIPELRALRGKRISMIFQDPMSALSPLHRIGAQLVEAIQLHESVSDREAWRRGEDWLGRVGIPDPAQRMQAWPHELSGGMRQRVMIAMALMLKPSIVIADEPTTALDVTIQAQIFDLMRELKDADTAIILITHDMGVIWEMCDRALVMYAGQVVEQGPVADLFRAPRHPYTAGLLRSMPRGPQAGRRLATIPGQVPSPRDYPSGCRFADRCPHRMSRCTAEAPTRFAVEPGRDAACFLVPEGRTP
ncbi:MAG TPA: ABC transporter ATP-binding protein [Kiritimatiellia bacterium]|nr:ABC transporter ATP-binding protein [Kiritimatiellia bacterium]